MSTMQVSMLSARIERLRLRALERGNRTGGKPGLRAVARMKAWRENPGVSWVQWRAYALRELAQIAPAIVAADELIVGEHLFSGDTWSLDFGTNRENALKDLAQTDLPEEIRTELAEFFKKAESMQASPFVDVGQTRKELEALGRGWGSPTDKGVIWAGGWVENHSIRDYQKVLRMGFEGIRREIQAAMEAAQPWESDYTPRHNFWLAALAVCDAGAALGRAYAAEARRLARRAQDEDERARLNEIARVAARVPARGARTLREAVQSLWFAHILSCADDGINANSIGRMDQFLYPFYRADLEAGRIDQEGAVELMEELACKLYLDYDVQQICLGGQTPEGTDAANDLTRLILEATERLGFIRCISVRLHRNSPADLLKRCARMAAHGGGIPFFFNDETVVKALTDRGIARDDALDYAPIGCVEITIPGRANPHAVSGWFNAAKCLELALFDGRDPATGEQLGARTGTLADYRTWDDLVRAYNRQVEYFARWIVYGCNRGELLQRERGPLPCWSTLTDECIARGRDITAGGARYLYHSICFIGAPNVADSLAALRELLYRKKAFSSDELLDALGKNFDGAQALRQMLLKRAPKYGNNIAEVDDLAAEVCGNFCRLMDTFRSPLGGRYFVHLFSFVCHVDFGKRTGALPDGRRAREPLAYSLSPQQGRDEKGLTAMLGSLARIPHDLAAGSSSAIIEIDPALVKGRAGVERLAGVLKTCVEMGIGQMQINVTTAEALRKAVEDPERYGNIQVRVSGYSSKFNILSRDLQEHIIARTKHRS